VLRIAPPMTVDAGQIDAALEIFAQSFRAIIA
jgi:4-aminobutyrate aminotransferase-like enzyme